MSHCEQEVLQKKQYVSQLLLMNNLRLLFNEIYWKIEPNILSSQKEGSNDLFFS